MQMNTSQLVASLCSLNFPGFVSSSTEQMTLSCPASIRVTTSGPTIIPVQKDFTQKLL